MPPTRPPKPSLSIGTGAVTIPYADLSGLLAYVAEMERYAAGLEAEAQAASQVSLVADPEAMAGTLRGAMAVASFAVAYLHPSMAGGSQWPAVGLRALADGLVKFFGGNGTEAEVASVFHGQAHLISQYNAYRTARAESWQSPCATCGCARDDHAATDDPLVRSTCSAHTAESDTPCMGYAPSAPLPPLPPL